MHLQSVAGHQLIFKRLVRSGDHQTVDHTNKLTGNRRITTRSFHDFSQCATHHDTTLANSAQNASVLRGERVHNNTSRRSIFNEVVESQCMASSREKDAAKRLMSQVPKQILRDIPSCVCVCVCVCVCGVCV